MLVLNDFKVVKNRQRPDICYAYEKYTPNKDAKYQIFTMNSGKTFLVSVISRNLNGKLVDTDFSENADSIEESLIKLNNFLKL